MAESHEGGEEAAAAETVDYEAIAVHYEARAAEAKATAAQHRTMAKTYKRPGAKRPAKPQMAKHCEEIADTMEKAAEAFSALAKEYRGAPSAK